MVGPTAGARDRKHGRMPPTEHGTTDSDEARVARAVLE